MELLKVDTLEEATYKLYVECSKNKIDTEIIKVSDALGRVLSEDVVSKVNVPSFNRSVVDGYAVIASDTQGASETNPSFLKVIGESLMGEECNLSIKHGECVYVPTGGMVPSGANACLMVEYTENITQDKIAIYSTVAEGKSLIGIGDDVKNGDVVLKKGKKLTPGDIGFLSSVAVNSISVYKELVVTIISTGNELVGEDEELLPGKVKDINTNLLATLAEKYGFLVSSRFLVRDDESALEKTLIDSMKDSDIVIISGGSSKGKKDMTSSVIDKVATSGVLTHGIAIKPGKPTITAYDSVTKTIIVGLPGHPVASAVLFKLIVVDVVNKLTSCIDKKKTFEGIITENLAASPGRMTLQLVNVDDSFNVIPIYGRSGLIRTLSSADGFIILERDSEGVNKGAKVKGYYL